MSLLVQGDVEGGIINYHVMKGCEDEIQNPMYNERRVGGSM